MRGHERSGRTWVLLAVVVVGLLVDAGVHLALASSFPEHRTSALTEATVFRVEAVVSVLAAVALVVRPRWYTAASALLVSASAVVTVVVYRYVDVGAIGPLPDMYDPYWGPPAKVLSVVAEAAAAVGSVALLLPGRRRVGGTPRVRARAA